MLETFPASPAELLVHDEPEPCPYLPGQIARLPLRVPSRKLLPVESDRHWEMGDRRHGVLLYRPACPACRACQPVRIPVAGFVPRATQRRILKKGDLSFTLDVGEPRFSRNRLALYEKHKVLRGLRLSAESHMGEAGYRNFFVEACVDAIELSFWYRGRLAAVAIADRGRESLSAVYTFYDPDLAALSPGAYSILKQIELCKVWGLPHLYLGFFVAENAHMRYKRLYRPQERLVDGEWQRFE